MRKNKKEIKTNFIASVILLIFFSSFHPIYAAPYTNQEKIPGASQQQTEFIPYLKDIINFGLAAIGIIALFMLIIGAYMYLMGAATGNVTQAKETITSALLGLILGLCAWVILYKINPDLVNFRAITQISGIGIPSNLSITGTVGNYATIKPSGDRAAATMAYIDTIKKYASEKGVPIEIAFGLIAQESSGNPEAVSPKGATGLGQIMPENFASLGITDPTNTDQSIRGAMTYLRQMYDQFGTWDAAVAAYNCGPNRFQKAETWGNLPTETRNHVPAVMGYANWYNQQNGQSQNTRVM